MTQALSQDTLACAQLVERGDPDRFASAMAGAVQARHVLFPIYAFNVEVARAPWVTQEAMIAEMRLQWWRGAMEEIAAGGQVRRHEVVTPLAQVLDSEGAMLLERLVAARRWDIYREPFEDDAHFDAYIGETAGALMLVAARALGPVDTGAVKDLGWASGLASYLRAIPELERQGRVPLLDGRAEAVSALAAKGLQKLDRARKARFSKQVRPALLAAWQAEPVLRQAVKAPQDVQAGLLGLSEVRRSARLSWCALTGRV